MHPAYHQLDRLPRAFAAALLGVRPPDTFVSGTMIVTSNELKYLILPPLDTRAAAGGAVVRLDWNWRCEHGDMVVFVRIPEGGFHIIDAQQIRHQVSYYRLSGSDGFSGIFPLATDIRNGSRPISTLYASPRLMRKSSWGGPQAERPPQNSDGGLINGLVFNQVRSRRSA